MTFISNVNDFKTIYLYVSKIDYIFYYLYDFLKQKEYFSCVTMSQKECGIWKPVYKQWMYKTNVLMKLFTSFFVVGTNSEILEPRIRDYHTDGIQNWNIMSLHNWGENPKGDWEITVMACVSNYSLIPSVYFKWSISLFKVIIPLSVLCNKECWVHSLLGQYKFLNSLLFACLD